MSDLALTLDLHATLSSLDYVVFLADATGYWRYLSPTWERLSGFSAQDCLGRSVFDYVVTDPANLLTWLAQPDTNFAVRLQTERGSEIWVDLQVRQSEAGLTGTLRPRSEQPVLNPALLEVQRLRQQVSQQALLRRWANLHDVSEAELAREVVQSLRPVMDAGYVALTGAGQCLAHLGQPGRRVWHLPIAAAWGHLSLSRDYAWQQWEVDWLQEAAGQISQTLHAIWRWQQMQQGDADMRYLAEVKTTQSERALAYEAGVVRVTQRIRNQLEPLSILQDVIEELQATLGTPSAWAGLIEAGQLKATCGLPATDPALWQAAVLSQACPLTGPAELVCPITVEAEVIGLLALQHRHVLGFSVDEMNFVQQVATQAAFVLQHAILHHQLQTQLEAEKRLGLLKDDFLSTVSHELRTPLTRMRMAIEMLGVSELTAQQRRYWDILARACEQERQLIEDLLTLQQFRSGQAPVTPMPLALERWLSEQVAAADPESWGAEIYVECERQLSTFWTDRQGLDRILQELLTNARKHGRSPITVQLSKQSERTVCLRVSNPAGLAVSELPNLFDTFYRVPQADRWKEGGMGLGLALVKAIVERLGGEITVDQSGAVITFTVLLPNLTP